MSSTHNEVNSGGMTHHSASLHGHARPLVPTPQSSTDDTTIQQLRQTVAIQYATILRYEAAAQESERFRSQLFQRSADAEERSIKHAETLNKAIVELEATISPLPPADWIPQRGEFFYGGFDLAERDRPGCLTRIGVVRYATWKLQQLRGSVGSDDIGGAGRDDGLRLPSSAAADGIASLGEDLPSRHPAGHDIFDDDGSLRRDEVVQARTPRNNSVVPAEATGTSVEARAYLADFAAELAVWATPGEVLFPNQPGLDHIYIYGDRIGNAQGPYLSPDEVDRMLGGIFDPPTRRP